MDELELRLSPVHGVHAQINKLIPHFLNILIPSCVIPQARYKIGPVCLYVLSWLTSLRHVL